MSNTSKADQLRALREGRVAGRKPAPAPPPAKPRQGKPAPKPAREPEPKRKRAPKGTFDKVAYQRDYMRKRRQAERERSTKK